MSWQPKAEKDAERELIIAFANTIGAKIIKLQGDSDDGGTDGIVEHNGRLLSVEARRKGFPNHDNVTSRFFVEGWKSKVLTDGIFLNERTIQNHKNKGFIFVVEIKGFGFKAAIITAERVEELLSQPYRSSKSTNSSAVQSVKTVPLDWFKELEKV